tara:strand:- start:78 stop:668 length:591 start_codon:yes stop_codon:yes gene_type:complete
MSNENEIFITNEEPVNAEPVNAEPIKKTRPKRGPMDDEAKKALLERLRLGRAKAKEKRDLLKKEKLEEIIIDDDTENTENDNFFNEKIQEEDVKATKKKGKIINNKKQEKYKNYIDLRIKDEIQKMNRIKKPKMKDPIIEKPSVAQEVAKVNIMPTNQEAESIKNNTPKIKLLQVQPKKEPEKRKIRSAYRSKKAW